MGTIRPYKKTSVKTAMQTTNRTKDLEARSFRANMMKMVVMVTMFNLEFRKSSGETDVQFGR